MLLHEDVGLDTRMRMFIIGCVCVMASVEVMMTLLQDVGCIHSGLRFVYIPQVFIMYIYYTVHSHQPGPPPFPFVVQYRSVHRDALTLHGLATGGA